MRMREPLGKPAHGQHHIIRLRASPSRCGNRTAGSRSRVVRTVASWWFAAHCAPPTAGSPPPLQRRFPRRGRGSGRRRTASGIRRTGVGPHLDGRVALAHLAGEQADGGPASIPAPPDDPQQQHGEKAERRRDRQQRHLRPEGDGGDEQDDRADARRRRRSAFAARLTEQRPSATRTSA